MFGNRLTNRRVSFFDLPFGVSVTCASVCEVTKGIIFTPVLCDLLLFFFTVVWWLVPRCWIQTNSSKLVAWMNLTNDCQRYVEIDVQ